MSPRGHTFHRTRHRFPRVSGDEPLIVAAYEARVPWADICLATGLTWQAAYNAYQRVIKRWTRE